jgi:Predicted pyridoxal phosphate-dependent enzyme apparently involved in regulation of cell wall biogenesis
MIPFSPPRIDQKIIDEVVDTLKSGWITTGPKTKLFEKQLTQYCGCKAVIGLNSATSGLELILRWFGVKEGDEVILPAYTYSATANVIIHCGAKPVFVDTDHDFNISVTEIEKAITRRTKVIMPVDIGGFPCNYEAINKLVSDDEIRARFVPDDKIQQQLGRILVLSDAAHSLGAEIDGKRTGSLTDVTVFSFHAVKNLTTAEGGAIAFNLPEPFDNIEIYNFFNVYILHGQNKDAFAKTKKGGWKYDILMPGYKANMTDIAASFGLIELARYQTDTLVKRKHIFDRYNELLSPFEWAILPKYETENIRTSYHLFMLRIKGITEATRDLIIQEIFDNNVSVNVHFKPVPMFSYYANVGYSIANYPVSYENFCKEITLPVFYDLTDEQIDFVANTVIKAVKKYI